jgi:hypothetical protein
MTDDRFFRDNVMDVLEQINKNITLVDRRLDLYSLSLKHLGEAIKALDGRLRLLEQ